MLKMLPAALALLGAVAQAQPVTSYRTATPAPVKGEPDKIVCQKEERIGTRLGGRKICLRVSEWNDRAKIHREQTERMQMGVCVPLAGCAEGQGEPY